MAHEYAKRPWLEIGPSMVKNMEKHESMLDLPPFEGDPEMDLIFYRRWKEKAIRIINNRKSPLLSYVDSSGNHLYRLTDQGYFQRTRKIPKRVRKEVLDRDGHSCVQCGKQGSLEMDHIVRYADGGPDTARNLQSLCITCHGKKGGR